MTDKDILWHLGSWVFFDGFCVGNLPYN